MVNTLTYLHIPHTPQFKKNVRCWEMFPRIDQRVSQPREVNLKKKRPTFNSIVILCCWSGARHTEGEMDGIHAVALEGHRLAWKTGVLIDRSQDTPRLGFPWRMSLPRRRVNKEKQNPQHTDGTEAAKEA